MLNPPCTIVMLTRLSRLDVWMPPCQTRWSPTVRMTAAQYAGNSRAIRDAVNFSIGRPYAVIRMTNPLTMKNSSTPRYP